VAEGVKGRVFVLQFTLRYRILEIVHLVDTRCSPVDLLSGALASVVIYVFVFNTHL
jgi:hypothetical protein